jgi:hypothetical protein
VSEVLLTAPGAIEVLATVGDRYSDFGPYVASVNDHGCAAFFARLHGGRTTVCVHDGSSLRELNLDDVADILSHPDIGNDGTIVLFARLTDGRQGLVCVAEGISRVVCASGDELSEVGPLGPTVNHHGTIAFRASDDQGAVVLLVTATGGYSRVAGGPEFVAFDGLPVVTEDDGVVFRGENGEGAGIYRWHAGVTETLVYPGQFTDLGRFPTSTDGGVVAVTAVDPRRGPGVFVDGGQVIGAGDRFASFRGVLISDSGDLVFYATPVGGTLGIFRREGKHPVLSLGDEVWGAQISEFALNPVSINNAGEAVVRVRLSDGRGLIAKIRLRA